MKYSALIEWTTSIVENKPEWFHNDEIWWYSIQFDSITFYSKNVLQNPKLWQLDEISY